MLPVQGRFDTCKPHPYNDGREFNPKGKAASGSRSSTANATRLQIDISGFSDMAGPGLSVVSPW